MRSCIISCICFNLELFPKKLEWAYEAQRSQTKINIKSPGFWLILLSLYLDTGTTSLPLHFLMQVALPGQSSLPEPVMVGGEKEKRELLGNYYSTWMTLLMISTFPFLIPLISTFPFLEQQIAWNATQNCSKERLSGIYSLTGSGENQTGKQAKIHRKGNTWNIVISWHSLRLNIGWEQVQS